MLSTALFNNDTALSSYLSTVWRVVESQETVATLNIVDTMEEHEMLESLLDSVKPRYRVGTEGLHYLIKTAFRYPPLKYGSRFGTRAMPSYFYASENTATALAETAYYRFLFFSHITSPYNAPVDSEHTAFSVLLQSTACLDLCSPDFHSVRGYVTDKANYRYCQSIGDWAINHHKVDLIRFESARAVTKIDTKTSTKAMQAVNANLAVADPNVITSKKPRSQESWLCRTTPERVSFSSRSAARPLIFPIAGFLVNGVLPMSN